MTTMCITDRGCPLAKTCKRSIESGTQPDKFFQPWAYFKYDEEMKGCTNYKPIKPKTNPKQQGTK